MTALPLSYHNFLDVCSNRLGKHTFTDHNNIVQARRHFDPFGKPRGGDWSQIEDLLLAAMLKNNPSDTTMDTRRGFTDHEHLDESELIHMNGRMYDYNVGRFMSVDPVIQSPGNSQSINPYSYIMNNPMSGTDPSGYTAIQEEPEKFEVTGSKIKRSRDAKASRINSSSDNVKFNGFAQNSESNNGAQGSGQVAPAQKPESKEGILSQEETNAKSESAETNQTQLTFEEARDALELGGLELTAEHNDSSLSYSAGNDTYIRISPTGSFHKFVNSELGLESVSPESYLIGGIGIKASAKGLSKIGAEAKGLLANGKSAESVVRYLSGRRNQLKLDVREQGPWIAKQWANTRNYFKYGNKAGPSPENLLDKYGSWNNALSALTRSSKAVDRMLGQ